MNKKKNVKKNNILTAKSYNFKVDEDNKIIIAFLETYQGIRFIGKAKCAPEDDFDIAIGKKLSAGRAFDKMLSYNARVIREEEKQLYKFYQDGLIEIKKKWERLERQDCANDQLFDNISQLILDNTSKKE